MNKSLLFILGGVTHLELKPILEFIYLGQASFYQERMKDFLRVGKDLQIKEIKDVPDEENNEGIRETEENEFHEEEVVATTADEGSNKDEIAKSTFASDSSQEVLVPNNSKQCPQCDVVFVHKQNMLAPA